MNNVPNTGTIINVAIISQYLFTRDILNNNFYGSKPIDKKRPRLLYNIRKSVEHVYTLNPSDPSLPKTGKYLFGLCEPHTQSALTIISNSTQFPPVITGPTNQSVNVGQNATFSVSVVSALPVTYQWYDYLGNPIPLATNSSYVFMNAQLTDSGKTFFVRVTNAAGSVVSSTATLTVAESIIGRVYYGDTDYSADLLAGIDNVPYVFSFNITHNANFNIQFPVSVDAKSIVIQYPDTEPTKINYNNPPIDSGPIPGFALGVNAFGGKKYAFSHGGNTFTTNPPNLLTLS